MLTNLEIKNIAVIDSLHVELGEGLSVLTGETGAGKSIIIDSINMVLGARTNKSLVRYGEKKAVVQAVFDAGKAVREACRGLGIEEEDGQVILSREMTAEGKSICRAGGLICPVSAVKSIASELIAIHGQHDNQALLTPARHVAFLDQFAENEACRREYADLYTKRKQVKERIDALDIDEKERAKRIDLLSYQAEEIQNMRLVPGEDAELSEQRDKIANAEKIASNVQAAYRKLYEEEEAQSAYDALMTAVQALGMISEYDEVLKGIYERVSDAAYTIEDAAHELRAYGDSVEYDEHALNEIEQRLDDISKLKRKYGDSIEEIIAYGEAAEKELGEIQQSDEKIGVLEKELQELTQRLTKAGQALYVSREEAGEALQKSIEASLAELDMAGARFDVSIQHQDEFFEHGMDRVEFLISTNRGEPLKPLVKIASGGELSRVMLAIKSILADSGDADTLIFDEIDTGVSGSAAQKIAVKLAGIAKKKQVICITHLPQIASMADHHFLIQKQEKDGRSVTSLCEITGRERQAELARIIDGTTASQAALSHAQEMLSRAETIKEEL
jgi:DNA repair protein RecN (Recombination protein N)